MSQPGQTEPRGLRSMPPAAARLCLRVEKFLRADLAFDPGGKELVLAYSGGADSTALLHILLALTPRLACRLSLAHLDHALRPSSAAEALRAEETARLHGLPCYSRRIDVAALAREGKIGLEEAGRAARLAFFREIQDAAPERRPEYSPERWIVYGHQLNDLAEDIIMRLTRGSGWPALGGMKALDVERRLLRPLLSVSRAELETFLSAVGASWVDDPLNQDRAFFRNRVRLDILPLLLRENPAFLKAADGLRRLAALDEEMLRSMFKASNLSGPQEEASLRSLPRAALLPLPKALRLRLYKQSLESMGPGQPLLRGLLALDAALEQKKTGTVIQFPGKKQARLLRLELSFSRG